MVDPDDMSVESDDEPSVLGGDDDDDDAHIPDSDEENMENGDAFDDPDEDVEDDEEMDGGAHVDTAVAAPEEDDEEEEEDDAVPQPDPEEEKAPPPSKKASLNATGIMKHFQVKQQQQKQQQQQAASSEKALVKPGPLSKPAEPSKPSKSPAATVRPKGGKAAAAAPSQPVALGKSAAAASKGPNKGKAPERPANPAAPTSAKKGKQATKPPGAKPPVDFSFHDSEEDDVEVTMPKNKGVSLDAPPDAEQEFEDFAKGGATSARVAADDDDDSAEEPPRVSALAKKRRYVMKNEKTKRWSEWVGEEGKGLLSAPDCEELFDLTMDDLTIASKKDRVAAQNKLADAQMPKIIKTFIVGELTMDSTGSGSGPGMTNLMGAIPSTVPLQDKELEDLLSRMQRGGATAAEEVVVLHLLDHDVVKRVFKVNNAPLPALYNPNTNPSNKYKVPMAGSLDKVKEFDSNFLDLGLVEKAKQRASKRSTEERPNGGGKADAKRAANGTASSSNAEAEVPVDGRENFVGIDGFTRHILNNSGIGIEKIESVPLNNASKTHCWIAGNRLYWAEHF